MAACCRPQSPPEPRLRVFTVVGIFEAGIQDHDATLAFANLDTLHALGSQSITR